MSAPPDRAERLHRVLRAAGEVAWAAWSPHLRPRIKADGTPVTDADLAAEGEILRGLGAAFPGDCFVTEESGGDPGLGAWWVVDPIDGTSSFVEGLAHWGPTVARVVRVEGRPVVDCGALWLPRLGEHYHVEAGGPAPGAWFNGRPMVPFAARRGAHTAYLPSRFHTHFRLRYPGKARCIGGTAAHLMLTARGAAELVIVAPGWSTWDTAAGLALIAVLGGRSALLGSGEPVDPFAHEGQAFVAGTPEVVDQVLRPGAIQPLVEEP